MDEKFFYDLTPEEQRTIVRRIIYEPPHPTEGRSNSVPSILRRLHELEEFFDRLPLTDKAHRTPDKDKPSGPYIPLAHR